MFHRAPFISAAAVATTALIILLGLLFALSLSSPGMVHASHSGMPEVSITGITPEIGEEDRRLRVTLKLSRPLTEDEKFCYSGRAEDGHNGEVCIQGGIFVWDTYDDHLSEGGEKASNEMVAFVFRNGETEKRLTTKIKDDQCITPNREIRVAINWSFRSDPYGYTIDSTQHTVRVSGDDTENGMLVADGGKCLPVDDGVTEEIIENRAPAFDRRDVTLSVAENTEAGEDVGNPITASDPDDDSLTYELTGADADSFDIDSSTGQIETSDELDHETKNTYHLAVSVSDGMDIYGDSDSAEDDSIDVTINVTNVNEAPEFDPNAPADLSVMEDTAADVPIGDPITATDPENDTITYDLDDVDGASFDIDTTGQIKTKDTLDQGTQDTYTITVTASDDNGADATHQVTITVTEANDPPTFNDGIPQGQTSITRSVAESTASGQPVGDPVSATDDDGDTLTYSLDDQDGAKFEIDSSGQIKTKDALDYEDTPSYSVTVSVTDSEDEAGNAEDPPVEDSTIDVTISVTDVNEPPAFAADAPATLEIAENTAADTSIGTPYTATDPDTTGDTLTYSLGGTGAASFAIDTATGQIKTKADLDYEGGTTSYHCRRTGQRRQKMAEGAAEDPPVADTTHTVTITVTDEDDPGSITFSSDPPSAGTAVTATLADDDAPISGETWVWEISTDSTDPTLWTTIIDADHGQHNAGHRRRWQFLPRNSNL